MMNDILLWIGSVALLVFIILFIIAIWPDGLDDNETLNHK